MTQIYSQKNNAYGNGDMEFSKNMEKDYWI